MEKLFQMNYLTTLTGEAVVTMVYHRPLTDEWTAAAEAMRVTLQARARAARSAPCAA